MWRDPAIYRYVPEEAPDSIEALAARYARLEARGPPGGDAGWLQWMVRVAADDDGWLGRVEATLTRDDRAQVAWMFASAHWGRGVAREAMEAVLADLASAHGIVTAEVAIDTRNARSLALARRLGFADERLVARADRFKGSWSDEVAMRLALRATPDVCSRG